jgi:adenylate kinase family enzyme
VERIVIVGTTGSGKSTLAARLSQQLDLRHIDLDMLHWESGWKGADSSVFRARVAAAVREGRWIVAGNYSSVRDLIWPNADTLIWLDYSLPIIFWRLLRRTFKRIVTREDLWGTGNR